MKNQGQISALACTALADLYSESQKDRIIELEKEKREKKEESHIPCVALHCPDIHISKNITRASQQLH